jgi:malonyl-CoA O-methyltransferase
MKIVKEFSRFAEEYKKHNIIQEEVAKRLTLMLHHNRYSKVLDLGCGSGAVYHNLVEHGKDIEKFIALDFSKEMLKLHPDARNIEKKCLDFNKKESFLGYKPKEFELLISSSALQWSEDLASVLERISTLAKQYYFAFFTSNTFKTLHQTAKVTSPIYSRETIIGALNKFYDSKIEVVEYRLDFESVHDMLRYIKRSGVSGGSAQLSYKSIKQLMREYPLDYLEFEVLFVEAVKR